MSVMSFSCMLSNSLSFILCLLILLLYCALYFFVIVVHISLLLLMYWPSTLNGPNLFSLFSLFLIKSWKIFCFFIHIFNYHLFFPSCFFSFVVYYFFFSL